MTEYVAALQAAVTGQSLSCMVDGHP